MQSVTELTFVDFKPAILEVLSMAECAEEVGCRILNVQLRFRLFRVLPLGGDGSRRGVGRGLLLGGVYAGPLARFLGVNGSKGAGGGKSLRAAPDSVSEWIIAQPCTRAVLTNPGSTV